MPFVYSTLTGTMDYEGWKNIGNGPKDVRYESTYKITIKGGANVASKTLVLVDGSPVHTFKGHRTEVTQEQLELLQANEVFQLHVKNGFIHVEKDKIEVEKVIDKMNPKDKSAPRTPKDYGNKVKSGRENGLDVETIEI